MRKTVQWSVLVTCLAALALTGCTARYKQLLEERDRELATLRDENSRLEVEVRSLRASEDGLEERLKLTDGEAKRLARALKAARERPVATPAAAPVDRELQRLARARGFRVESRPEGTAVVLPSVVTFRSGSASLTRHGRGLLDALARTLSQRFAGRTLSIEGHTDAAPIRKSKFGTNWRLSAERAEAVRQYLHRKGVGRRAKVRVVGYGPTVPVATNGEEAGRRRNRRVEVVILNG